MNPVPNLDFQVLAEGFSVISNLVEAAVAWEQIPGWAECEDHAPPETQRLLEAVRRYNEIAGP